MTKALMFSYFAKEGVYFRRESSWGPVTEIWTSKGWQPYLRNGADPVLYGDQVPESELPPAAR